MSMQTVRCEKGHTWDTDGQETVAMCPECGAAPITDVLQKTCVTPEVTIGVDAEREAVDPSVTIASEGALEQGPEQLTVDLPGGLPRAQRDEPDATIGVEDEDGAAADEDVGPVASSEQTLPVEGEAHLRDQDAQDRTMAHVEAPPDESEETPDDGTLAFVKEEDRTEHRQEDAAPVEGTVALAERQDRTAPAGADSGTLGRAGQGEERTSNLHGREAGPGARTYEAVPSRTGLARDAATFKVPPAPALHAREKKEKKDRKDPLKGKKVVAGYEILGELGRGGMGVVYKARQPGANRLVALKMVLASGHAGAEALARFKIEAEAVAQLQHPNIVQLYEVGEEDGIPFFSLEFIDGDNLAKKIDSTPQPPLEAAALVQKLAEAMHLAHARGIIHRDLKPANVLLTKDGVPKITDFGLAKRFEDKDEGQTRTGAIMGTPSYMAPEQAQGKTKDTGPPADIYSLGSILYDLLTGRPPFRGTTLLETLQQVQSMEPLPPKRLQPGLPFDLQTICLKALEKDPAKRYATAGELAEDLRRFQAGEPILARPTPWYERGWKWARRRPAVATLVAVSVLGVLSLLTLGGLWLDSERRAAEERETKQAEIARIAQEKEALAKKNEELAKIRAEEQREQAKKEALLRAVAEKNFRRAKQAVDEMLSQVGQDKLRHIPQMDKVRRELLQKALGFYEEFKKEQSDDPNIRWETALAQQRVADILEQLGQHAVAEKAYAAALAQFQKLVKEDPTKLEYQRDLAALSSNFGNLLKAMKRNKDAEQIYREALKSRLALVEKGPEFALELAKNRNNLAGILQVLGKLNDAESELRGARKLLTVLVLRFPKNATYHAELARTLNNLGQVQKALGRTDLAEEAYLEANKLLARLVNEFQEDREYRRDLAQNHNLLADLLRDSKPAQADSHYQQAIKLRGKLAADFPDVPAFAQELAETYGNLAVFAQQAGRPMDADQAALQGIKIQQKVADDFPHLPDFRRQLGTNYVNYASLLLAQGRSNDAEMAGQNALKIFAALLEEHGDVPRYHSDVAGAWFTLGTVRLAGGKTPEAEEAFHKARAGWENLHQKYPSQPEYQQDLGNALVNLGLLQRLKKDLAASEKTYQEAVTLLAGLAKEFPHNPDGRRLYALAHTNLSYTLRELGKTKEAQHAIHSALDAYAQLVQDFPALPSYAQEAAKVQFEYGVHLAGGKRFAEAEQAMLAALGYRQKLFDKEAGNKEYRLDVGRSLGNLGVLKTLMGQQDKAEQLYGSALRLLEEAASKPPVTVEYYKELIDTHRNYAALMQGLNKPAEAEKSQERMVELHEQLVAAFPKELNLRLDAVRGLNELGNQLLQKEKFALARDLYQKAVEHLRLLAKSNPDYGGSLFIMQLNLANSLAGLKDHGAAAKVLNAAVKEVRPKDVAYQHAAALLSRCAGLALKDKGLPEDKAKEQAKTYGDQAVQYVQQALMNGFRDAAFFRGDDFEPLRARDDFQKVLKELK